jgi:asparagine synthase (glutamine-hydrolysing)
LSGICGVLHLRGESIDRSVMDTLASTLEFRAPDRLGLWVGGPVGLAHALLRTVEPPEVAQPFSLCGSVWIAADARIDGRAALVQRLVAAGRQVPPGASDPELILHAYLAWGKDCARNLLGDFAFAIWDARTRTLFCARDHFGIKPFFYAVAGDVLVFSNTLGCVRAHPRVSSKADDIAIADFLLFEENQDPDRTAFASIRRLLPAHAATWKVGGANESSPFWALPTQAKVANLPGSECLAQFTKLLNEAVEDRLRTARLSVDMSGGLDSPSVAAVALDCLTSSGAPFSLSALTVVYDNVPSDEERHYAGLVAAHLNIPITFNAADRFQILDFGACSKSKLVEPGFDLFPSKTEYENALSARNGRVVLTGWDGDAILTESPKPYLRTLVAQRRLGRAAAASIRYLAAQRRFLPLTAVQWFAPKRPAPESKRAGIPQWVAPELVHRLHLQERWNSVQQRRRFQHPVRPYAYRVLSDIQQWASFFEPMDPGVTGAHVEYRHPLMDVRLIEFCLALPPVPWCVNKEMLRRAMKGRLPEAIRRRPKALLGNEPLRNAMLNSPLGAMDNFRAAAGLERYVLRTAIPSLLELDDTTSIWERLRPFRLNAWLARSRVQVAG